MVACYITMLCVLVRWIYRQQLQPVLGKPNYIYSFTSALHPLRPPPQTWFSSCDKPRTSLAWFFTAIHWRTCSYPLTAAVELLINCRQDFSNLKKVCSTVSPTHIQIVKWLMWPAAADIYLQSLFSGYLNYKLWKLQTLNLHWWPSTIGRLDILG